MRRIQSRRQRGNRRSDSTTLRVTRRVVNHLYAQALLYESVNDTAERLLKLKSSGNGPKQVTAMTTIKVSRAVLKKLEREARKKESRGQTFGRLIGVVNDDGNVEGGNREEERQR